MRCSQRQTFTFLAGVLVAAAVPAGEPIRFDAYRPDDTQTVDVSFGTFTLAPGPHTFTFRVVGRHPDSLGYQVGIDTLTVSPCGLPREAEAQLPPVGRWGPAPSGDFVDTNALSGTRALRFPATWPGQFVSLAMANDRWEETNFAPGEGTHDRTLRKAIPTNAALDFAIQLEGDYNVNWRAADQIGNSNRLASATDQYRGWALRVVIRGRNATEGGQLLRPSGTCWVLFRPGGGTLRLSHAFIAEAVVSNGIVSPDTIPGTLLRLKTGSGADGFTAPANTAVYMGYPALKELDPDRSYAVTYLIDSAANSGNLTEWRGTNPLDDVMAYLIPANRVPTLQTVTSDTWSARGDLLHTNALPGVELLFGSYLTNGTYTSRIVDTRTPAPEFTTITWHAQLPASTNRQPHLGIRVRSGNADMSDAPDWPSIPLLTLPGALSLAPKRFVQFQVLMQSPSPLYSTTPNLADITIAWTGTTQTAALSGRILTGPDFGIWELLVDVPPPPPSPGSMLLVR